MVYLAIALSAAVLVYLFGRVFLLLMKDLGREEVLRQIAERDALVRQKQAEEMTKEKTVEDAARSLDDGSF